MAKKNIPYDQKYYDPEIECMPRPELEAMQLERLQEMVAYAYENTVWYKRSFDEAGVAPTDIKTLKDLEKFPFVDKKTERETQHVGSFFGEMCSVPEEEVIFMATSSGSTGVPTVSPFTQEDFDLWQDTEARLFWQAGMRPTDRYVHGLNFALYVGGPDVIGAQRLGALAIWVGAVPSDRLIFVLQQYQPTVIWTSPSYAWTLGEKIKEKGLDPRRDFSIHTIIVAGEPGGSIKSTREAIEDLWGAKVVDFFGLSDIYGACAAACEAHDGLHIVEDQILVETVDPATGEVLEPGEVGELVYTTLMKKARPMIRFRTGDIGYVSNEQCTCGRKGCFEAYASATALTKQTKRAMEEDTGSAMWKLCTAETATAKTAFDCMDSDVTARRVVERYINYLACGLVNLANTFRPQVIMLGGGISNQGENLIAPLRKKFDKELFGGVHYAPVKIVRASLGASAGVYGAAALAMQ